MRRPRKTIAEIAEMTFEIYADHLKGIGCGRRHVLAEIHRTFVIVWPRIGVTHTQRAETLRSHNKLRVSKVDWERMLGAVPS